MKSLIAITVTLLSTVAFSGTPALANDGKEQQCIRLSAIDQTPVIDNRTILVEMKGKGSFKRIDLLNRCSGLKIEGGFGYSTSINKLCKQDRLTVLRSGTPCMIDKIVDISEEEAEALLDRKYGRTAELN
ncbi:MAG: hypothetical protein ACJZ9F_02760 [Rhodospirillaceae bacterium]